MRFQSMVGWSSSCPPHEILYRTSLDLQWMSASKAQTSQVRSFHPFCFNVFDFVKAFFTVHSDLSMTFTLNPSFLKVFLPCSIRSRFDEEQCFQARFLPLFRLFFPFLPLPTQIWRNSTTMQNKGQQPFYWSKGWQNKERKEQKKEKKKTCTKMRKTGDEKLKP